MTDKAIEALAVLAHEQWSGWTEYMLDNMDDVHIAGWRRQIATPYAELSEREKESDRKEARRMLAVMGDFYCNVCGEQNGPGPQPDSYRRKVRIRETRQAVPEPVWDDDLSS